MYMWVQYVWFYIIETSQKSVWKNSISEVLSVFYVLRPDLTGIGSFTIVDGGKVTGEDIGNKWVSDASAVLAHLFF